MIMFLNAERPDYCIKRPNREIVHTQGLKKMALKRLETRFI